MLESTCRDTASLRFTDTRQVIGARLDVGVCLCGSCMVPKRLAEHNTVDIIDQKTTVTCLSRMKMLSLPRVDE